MARHVPLAPAPDLPPLPFDPAQWSDVARELHLSPQQARIVELILRNLCDKQIAATMGLRVPTVRTYLSRIFARLGVSDRLGLVLRVFALVNGAACHRQ